MMWLSVATLSRPLRHPVFRAFSVLTHAPAAPIKGYRATGTWKRNQDQSFCTLATSTNTCIDKEDIFTPQPMIDRAAEKRSDSKWLSEAFSTSALIIPLLGSKSLIKDGKPVMLPSSSFLTSKFMENDLHLKPIFLGLEEAASRPVFAVDISSTVSNAGVDMPSWLEGTDWVDLRSYGSQLPMHDAGLLAYARGMVEWLAKNKFCSRCGEKVEVKEGGHSLHCSSENCRSSIYPRLDPAVIILVTCGDYVLLGRQSRWEAGRYSLLAGFVEVGETFERAACREVHEETGVKLKMESLRYIASQPWPFPSSLMVGFFGESEYAIASEESGSRNEVIPVGKWGLHEVSERRRLPKIEVDGKELEDARWIHRGFLTAVLQGTQLPGRSNFNIPGKHAIAQRLMQHWISQYKDPHWEGDKVPVVEISKGLFKYVLIRVFDDFANQKVIIRGGQALDYHADIFKEAREKLNKLGLAAKPLGGGRIEHNGEERTIHVYGFSQAYGQANHELTVTLLQQWLPLHSISFSWDGY